MMKPSVSMLLDEAQKKMSAYAALLNYRFINLSVKAQAGALLSVTVSTGGESLPIERVALARCAAGRDDRFEIYPMNRGLLSPLLAALQQAHPEYSIELKDISGSEDAEGKKDQYILATVPEVDDARHGELLKAVQTLSGRADDLLKMTSTQYSDRIDLVLPEDDAEDKTEAKDALQDLLERHKNLCKQFRDAKEKEIEDAYKHYKEKSSGQKSQADAAKTSSNAGKQMRWTTDDE